MKPDATSPSTRARPNGERPTRSDTRAYYKHNKGPSAPRGRRRAQGNAREIGGTMAKALGILEHIAENRGRPAAVADISSVLGVSKPTGHRIAATLEEMGYLKRDPVARRLIEGDRLVRLAFNVLTTAASRSPRHSILEALAEATGETCNVGVVAGNQVAYIDRVESRWPLGLRFEPGSRVPMHCTAIGKLLLSTMSPKQRERFLSSALLARYTHNTITDPAALRRELAQIRKRKISTDDQEFMSGVVCVAVPIVGWNGRVCAGVALSAPHARLTLEQALDYLPPLQEAARKLSESFGDEQVCFD
jgi:DNA-binding IclR family transcriptional regulator